MSPTSVKQLARLASAKGQNRNALLAKCIAEQIATRPGRAVTGHGPTQLARNLLANWDQYGFCGDLLQEIATTNAQREREVAAAVRLLIKQGRLHVKSGYYTLASNGQARQPETNHRARRQSAFAH